MQEPGEIEAEFAKIGTERVMTEFLTYHTPKPLMLPKGKGFGHPLDTPIPLPPWLSHQDIQYYASKFDTKGFTAPINYYRNLDRCAHFILIYHIPYTAFRSQGLIKYSCNAPVAGTGNSMLHSQGLKWKFQWSSLWVTLTFPTILSELRNI